MIERRMLDIPIEQDRRARGRDRRNARRYAAGGTLAVLTWAEGDDMRTASARLRDISLAGGSALVESPPPKGTLVWFRLQSDLYSNWLGAYIIGVSRTGVLGRGPRLVRWRFRETCPYEIFKAAIEGFTSEVAI